MSSKNGVAESAPGVEQQKKAMTVEDVERALKHDLPVCINMLCAIHDDQDALRILAQVLHGKFMNHKHLEELKKQQNLEFVKNNQ